MIQTVEAAAPPLFSIVIPTLNEEKFLPLLLQDLQRQTCQDFEVVHVDGQSADQTVAQAARFVVGCRLRTVTTAQRSVSFQRNLGGEHARGRWVIFMDADNRIKRTFLTQLQQQLHHHPHTDVFTCLIDNPRVSPVLKKMLDLSNLIMLASAKVRPFAAGALIGIRRDHLPHLQFNCAAKMSEDHQFVEEAVKKGCHYQVFSQPRYAFSMRRFEKEGSLRVIAIYVRSAAVLLAGPRFERYLPDYPMLGGTGYDEVREFRELRGFLPSMGDVISRTTRSQQLKLRTAISRLLELINDR